MVALAGGEEVAGRPAQPSYRTSWAHVLGLEPDLVVLAPCGYDLERTLGEAHGLELGGCRAVAVDANGYFSRPAPRLAGGVELLAHLLHPELVADPDVPWRDVLPRRDTGASEPNIPVVIDKGRNP